jgi:hypothetical protein
LQAAAAARRRAALDKKPRRRPSAAQLLEHPWLVTHVAAALAAASAAGAPRRAAVERLLDPIPIYRVDEEETPEDTVATGAAATASTATSTSTTIAAAPYGRASPLGSSDVDMATGDARARSGTRVKFDACAGSHASALNGSSALRDLRAEFAGNVDAPTSRSVSVQRSVSSKSSLSFSMPANYAGMQVRSAPSMHVLTLCQSHSMFTYCLRALPALLYPLRCCSLGVNIPSHRYCSSRHATVGTCDGPCMHPYNLAQARRTRVQVQQLSLEEKGETGAAVGMKARLQLYMERQRT